MVASKPAQCSMCALASRGTGFARAAGTGKNGVMLLGEALGRREAQLSEPFVGEAGAQLGRTLQRVAAQKYDFRITNCVCCQPPNNWLEGAPWEGSALNNCRYYLEEEILRTQPKVIVALGNVAMRVLIDRSGIEAKRGYVYRYALGGFRCWVVPTYHPSFIMRGKQNLTDVQAIDIKRALRVAREGYTEPDSLYLEQPSRDTVAQYVTHCITACEDGAWLAADIETPKSGGVDEDEYGEIMDTDIICISFAYKGGYAISIPWTNENYEYIQQILALKWPYIVFWNQLFDVPRLKSKGITFGGAIFDSMYCWHWLQSDLPKRLGFVAAFFTDFPEWKSLSDVYPAFYSCRDADATIQCTIAMVKRLREQGRFESFVRHYVELQPHIEAMGATGVIIDPVQHKKFEVKVDAELGRINEEIQNAVPLGVKSVKRRKSVPIAAALGTPVRLSDPAWYWDYDRDTGEWLERQAFLYNSPKQVVAYMRCQKHPVPTNYKTGKDTTGAADLEKLADSYPDDPLYPRILGAREFRKVKGQYIQGYEPDPDGRVRTHFNRKPSTLRFNAEDPNVMNVLKRSDLAKEYRKQFIAAPGHLLVELDWKALEAQLTGFYAKDPDYVRASKLGIHAILMSHVLGKPIDLALPNKDILRIVRELKSSNSGLYNACKMVVHSSNYGSRPKRLRIEYPEYFRNVKEATDLQNLYFATIARKVKQWQQDTLRVAFEQHYLRNVWGYSHYFWDVLHYVGSQLEWGTDAKRALAFLPQSTGAGLLCEALINIQKRPEVFKMVRWVVHDSILTEIPTGDEFMSTVIFLRTCMEAPQPLLDGLSIETEIEASKSWGDMKLFEPETYEV